MKAGGRLWGSHFWAPGMIGIYIVKKIVQPNPVVIFVSSQARTTRSFARFESQDLRVASVCWHQRMRRA